MKGIKNILFDLGGVILQLDRPRCIHNFVQLGLHNIDQLTGPYSQDGIFMELEEGTISPEQFRDKVRLEVGNPLTDKQIDDAWNSFLVSVPAAHLELLLRLRREGYKVYLLSNTNHIHWQWCLEHVFNRHGHSIHDYFDNLFLSYELHLRKPETSCSYVWSSRRGGITLPFFMPYRMQLLMNSALL